MAFVFRSFRAVLLLFVIVVIAVSTIQTGHAKETKARKGVAAADAKKAKVHKADESGKPDEDRVRKGVEAFIGLPELAVTSVARIPQGGLYEIVLGNGELIYTDKAVSFFILGNIIDVKTRKDLTSDRLEKLASIDFKSLPLEHAIKRVNGNGQRVIVTFEDPNCGYCKHLGQELQKIKDVTIYTFLNPILSADSIAKSRHIWCAKDKAAAWTAWIIDGKAPPVRECDDSTVIDNNIVLARKLRMTGTPVLFFANGARIVGYREAPDLEQILEKISADAGK